MQHPSRPGIAPPDSASVIEQEFRRRDMGTPSIRYDRTRPEVLFEWQSVGRAVLAGLRGHEMLPLTTRTILDVGCGVGGWLAEFESWGAARSCLAGIDLVEERLAVARGRLGAVVDPATGSPSSGADLRRGDASSLPWADSSFDVVTQFTVFSSILDPGMRAAVAAEMLRVVRPDGVVLSYDMVIGNPGNRRVRPIRRGELQRLFPGCDVAVGRVSLAPPLTRRLAPVSATAAMLLQDLRLLNTHALAVVRPSLG